MCYGYRPVHGRDGRVIWVDNREYHIGIRKGYYQDAEKTFVFPFKMSDVLNMGGKAEQMQFDLLPRFFLKNETIPLSEVQKRKKSRKKDKVTGKSVGFNSFNARFETIERLPSFRNSWFESKRCAIPIDAFKERPNKENAPKEFQNIEITVGLSEVMYLGAIWDEWNGKMGETLRSFALITIDSAGSPFFESIWHERMPVLLTEAEAHIWLDSSTKLNEIKLLCDQLPNDKFEILSNL
jgi:putative SOS response-associated peptidase YedK